MILREKGGHKRREPPKEQDGQEGIDPTGREQS
jgi:hypothetical protein